MSENESRPTSDRAASNVFADIAITTGNHPEKQPEREHFEIVVAVGLWKGFDVEVRPPTAKMPMRHFRTRAEALIFAIQLSALQGWPVFDREGDQA